MKTQSTIRACVWASALSLSLAACKKEEPPPVKSDRPPATAAKPAEPSQAAAAPVVPLTGIALKAWYDNCWNLFNTREWDKFAGCYDENATSDAVDAMPTVSGRKNIIDSDRVMWEAAFPDGKGNELLTLVNGRSIARIALFNATHSGALKLPGNELAATGKKVGYFMGHAVEVGENNQVKKEWIYADNLTVLGQIGAHTLAVRPVAEELPMSAQTIIAQDNDVERKNVETVTALVSAFNKRDKTVGDFFADQVRQSNQAFPSDITGKRNVLAMFDALAAGFSDLQITSERSWAAGPYVVSFDVMKGTNNGDFAPMNIKKTSKPTEIKVMHVWKVETGKVTTLWGFMNGMKLATDLGLLPKPAAAAPVK